MPLTVHCVCAKLANNSDWYRTWHWRHIPSWLTSQRFLCTMSATEE